MRRTGDLVARLLPYVLALSATSVFTAIFVRAPVNATTVALGLVPLVLMASLFGGLGPGLFSSFVAALSFNFFFLEPKGTLRIDDPQDWVAVGTFLVSAVTVNRLSSSVRQRAIEAESHKVALAKLGRLSRALIAARSRDGLPEIARVVLEAFSLDYCGVHVQAQGGTWQHGQARSTVVAFANRALPPLDTVPIDITTVLDEYERGVRYVDVSSAERQLGILTIKPGIIPAATLDAIAGVLALAIDSLPLSHESKGEHADT
ncbi:MAG: DUF4118 domain-containing protein [Acidobacteria bacterium]|nr:DUF4118 domain-containing protein [Acidobacteriota bacterium]